MEPIEYLMVGKETAMQGMVDESFVQGLVHVGKADVIASFLENVLQSLGLLFAVRTDIKGIPLVQELLKTSTNQFEILVEYGLGLRLKLHRRLRSSRWLVSRYRYRYRLYIPSP